tara:strand:+ start:441 stop:743 length:303 start_codon:yes stop_codon:yes gene_type:complete
MVKINVVMDYDWTLMAKKTLKIRGSKDLNGWYFYDKDEVYINLGSKEYKIYKTVDSLIKLFAKTVTHEVLHHSIYHITKEDATIGEEEVVEQLAVESMRL